MLVTPQQLKQAAVALEEAQKTAAEAQSSLLQMEYKKPNSIASLDRIKEIAQMKAFLTYTNMEKGQFPHYTTEGKWVSKGIRSWTAGFFPGELWILYELTKEEKLKSYATKLLSDLEPVKTFRHTHDVGFIIMCSFGNAVRLAPELMDYGHSVILTAANSLSSRFNKAVGAMKALDNMRNEEFGSDTFPVLIDGLVNIELLFAASKLPGGTASWYHEAVAHAQVTLHNHVREDGSTKQVVHFNPDSGAVMGSGTIQGASDESTWSRGQAFAIYGFAIAYRETGIDEFLIAAHVAADWLLMHLPADMIPPWDFSEGTTRGLAGKDSSAAAIAAAGMLEMCSMPGIGNHQYCEQGRRILEVLSSPDYLDGMKGGEVDALLRHGTGHMPRGIFDGGLVYGDYYYLKALTLLLRLEQTQPDVFQHQWMLHEQPAEITHLHALTDEEMAEQATAAQEGA